MDFRIVDVFELDCHLIVKVEHYNADDSFWHVENYRWQGREGLAQKRRRSEITGNLMMDNGEDAPIRAAADGDPEHAYLPEGRTWARLPAPYMDDESILSQIRETHAARLVSGWPQGSVDVVGRIPDERIAQIDRDGCATIFARFESLKERSE